MKKREIAIAVIGFSIGCIMCGIVLQWNNPRWQQNDSHIAIDSAKAAELAMEELVRMQYVLGNHYTAEVRKSNTSNEWYVHIVMLPESPGGDVSIVVNHSGVVHLIPGL